MFINFYPLNPNLNFLAVIRSNKEKMFKVLTSVIFILRFIIIFFHSHDPYVWDSSEAMTKRIARDLPRCNHCQLACLHGGSYLHRLPVRVRQKASQSWCSCGQATNFRGIGSDCRLAAPTDFIRGISTGKQEFFRLEWRTRIPKQWLPLVLKTYLSVLNGTPTEDGYFVFNGVVNMKKFLL